MKKKKGKGKGKVKGKLQIGQGLKGNKTSISNKILRHWKEVR